MSNNIHPTPLPELPTDEVFVIDASSSPLFSGGPGRGVFLTLMWQAGAGRWLASSGGNDFRLLMPEQATFAIHQAAACGMLVIAVPSSFFEFGDFMGWLEDFSN